MAVIYTQADYEGRFCNDPHRGDLPHYRDGPQFASRAQVVRGRFTSGKILVAGCGYGFLVKHLISLGLDAWGCDASAWVVSQAANVVPGKVVQANITSRSQLATTLTAAGLTSRQRFAAVITEDVLTCLTDAEITTALTELRRISSALFHIVSAVEFDRTERNPVFTWKTLPAWKAVVGTEPVMGLESESIL